MTVRERAEYLVRLVNGSQCLEGAGLTPEGREELVKYAEELLRQRELSLRS